MLIQSKGNAGMLALRSATITAVSCMAVLAFTLPSQAAPHRSVNAARVSYDNLPFAFEANLGQTNDSVKFLLRTSHYTMFLSDRGAVLALKGPSAANGQNRRAVRLDWVGATTVAVVGEKKLAGISNYLLGDDPQHWVRRVPQYTSVRYSSLYPGVDLRYYGSQRKLEYDVIVLPGGDLAKVQLRVVGAKLSLSPDGDVVVDAQGETVLMHRPHVWQKTHDGQRDIYGGYRLLKHGRLVFKVGKYDHRKPLIIDPVLTYSTFLGGSGVDLPQAIAVDSAGDAYVTGATSSPDFPKTVNSTQPCQGAPPYYDIDSCSVAFVTELNPGGTGVIYSTFLGGHAAVPLTWKGDGYQLIDGGNSIAVDASGNALVAATIAGAGVLYKLSPDGATVLYSMDFGANGLTTAVAVDGAGNAYVTGLALAGGVTTTLGAFQTSGAGGSDAFVSKVDPSGTLVYSTLLGGSGDDIGTSIDVDSSGNAYVAGATLSTDFPVTVEAYNTSAGGSFIVKLNPSGTGLVYSTFFLADYSYTGEEYYTPHGTPVIAVDPSGSVFIASNGGNGLLVSELNSSGSALSFSTPFGGNGGGLTAGSAIAVDASGNVFVAGTEDSTTAVPQIDAIQPCSADVFDLRGFLSEFDSTGSPVFSTCLGGSSFVSTARGTVVQQPLGVATNGSNTVFVTGFTGDSDYPVTAGAFQSEPANKFGPYVMPVGFVGELQNENLPSVVVSPGMLTFPSQQIGTSTELPLLVTNSGTEQLTVSNASISDSSDFALTNNCTSSLALGQQCSLAVTFAPVTVGNNAATISIIDNAAGSPQTINVTGTAVLGPAVTLSAQNFSFTAGLGSTSSPQTLTVTNSGQSPLSITSLAITGDFAAISQCGGSLGPSATCPISITFTPTATGIRTGTLTLIDGAADSPQIVALNGNGGSGPAASLSATSLSFGSQPVGLGTASQTITAISSGTVALTITGVATSGDFSQTNNCTGTIAIGVSCRINVTFTPTAGGARTGALTINDNAPGSPQTVSLSGAGEDFSLSPGSSSSTTVSPGQTAMFSVTVSPAGGFNQMVSFACSGAPALSTCIVSPSSVAVSAGTTVSVSMTTSATSTITPVAPTSHDYVIYALAVFIMFSMAAAFQRRHIRNRPVYGLSLILAICTGLTLFGCGAGGAANSTGGGDQGTPAGTYTLTVSGTFATGSTMLTRNTTLSVVVR